MQLSMCTATTEANVAANVTGIARIMATMLIEGDNRIRTQILRVPLFHGPRTTQGGQHQHHLNRQLNAIVQTLT